MSNNPENREGTRGEFLARIGTFLILAGLFFFILFIASDYASQTDFDWLFLGLLFLVAGFILRRRAPPPRSSGRFSTLKRLRAQSKKRKEENRDKDRNQ